MLNFEFYNPTRIVFGKDQFDRMGDLLTDFNAKKVLFVYGGGSIKRTGLYDTLMDKLNDIDVVEFGGVEANPQYSTLMKAVELGRQENIDFVLAVGGGSVIDGVKFIAGAIPYKGEPWDVLDKKEGCVFTEAIPFGTVLTLPATGSEANSGAVISRSEITQKRVMGGPYFFPKFSICDPTQVATLPERQLANGIVDSYVHTLEQYITYPSGNLLQERQAEGILATLKEIATGVVKDPSDYTLAANLMWCSTHALIGTLRCGVPTDWATHMIGHELTAQFGIDHARTLAIILPRLYEHELDGKEQKLAQYGRRVLGLTGEDDRDVALRAIQETESFFHELGIDTYISEYSKETDGIGDVVKGIFEDRSWNEMGERGAITPDDVKQIVEAAI